MSMDCVTQREGNEGTKALQMKNSGFLKEWDNVSLRENLSGCNGWFVKLTKPMNNDSFFHLSIVK